MKSWYFFLLFMLTAQLEAVAKHIIGGVMYYEFVRQTGNKITYKIVLKMYRDCKPELNKADFDGLTGEIKALGTVYRGSELTPVEVIDFGRPVIRKIESDAGNKCLVLPPGICVEEGVYSATVELPVSTSSYHISYQRCCRNNSISNIVTPGDVGATFTVEITSLAQSLHNSSPQFVKFPAIAICANFPIQFDHAASDIDGDSLVYSLCAPFVGGGNDDMGNSGCYVVAPQPDCPPPYSEVVFRSPYTPANPLGGNPVLTIDARNGFLSGTPNVTGQFVVGIMVREYRNGKLLSEVRRDFQFNVTSCEKTVDAIIAAAGLEGKDLQFKLCGDSELDLTFKGNLTADIFDLLWTFEHNGKIQTGANKTFTLNTEELGTYSGKLVLNPGLPCSDSARAVIQVFPDIRADFGFDYDTCYGKIIYFKNKSVSDAGPITQTSWKANEVVFSNATDSQFNILKPDYYDMEIVVEDKNGCMDSMTRQVPFFPIPKDELVDPGNITGCAPFVYRFKKPNDYITDRYEILWTFGDGQTGSGVQPTHQYEQAGIYSVGVSVKNIFGCQTSDEFPNTVTVLESPVAGFSYLPQNPSNLEPTVAFSDQSLKAQFWFYDFGNGDNSSVQNPVYTYPDTGVYYVRQIVRHENGCRDTMQILLDVAPRYTLYLPNAFIAGSGSLNAEFGPVGVPFGVRNYEMLIFDRWGNKVFESKDFDERWDGRDKKGNILPKGVYSVKIDITEPRGARRTIYGSAVLIQ